MCRSRYVLLEISLSNETITRDRYEGLSLLHCATCTYTRVALLFFQLYDEYSHFAKFDVRHTHNEIYRPRTYQCTSPFRDIMEASDNLYFTSRVPLGARTIDLRACDSPHYSARPLDITRLPTHREMLTFHLPIMIVLAASPSEREREMASEFSCGPFTLYRGNQPFFSCFLFFVTLLNCYWSEPFDELRREHSELIAR